MKVFLLFIGLFSFTAIFAQGEFKFGAKGGLSLATLEGNEIFQENGNRYSFHIGGFTEYTLNEKIAVEAGLQFSSQGARKDEIEFRLSADSEPSLFREVIIYNYLNLPIQFKYYLVNGLNVKAGPQIGFLLSAENKNVQSIVNPGTSVDLDIRDFTKTVDFGALFGLGYQFDSGILIDFNYYLGLTDTVDSDSATVERKNRVLQLSVGYRF